VLHNGGCNATSASVPAQLRRNDMPLPGRVALYRCYDGNHHFISQDARCGGAAMEQVRLLVFPSLRAINYRAGRCWAAAWQQRPPIWRGRCAAAVPCPAGTVDVGLLGYVR
jgi:hypothetical protein